MKVFITSLLVALTLLAPTTVFAAASCGGTGDNSSTGQALQGLNAVGATDCTNGSVKTLTSEIISLLSIIVGIAAVIMILVSGFKYITSGGDSNAISSAKRTLIYAIIGLAIVALSQFISHFAINTTQHAITPPPATAGH